MKALKAVAVGLLGFPVYALGTMLFGGLLDLFMRVGLPLLLLCLLGYWVFRLLGYLFRLLRLGEDMPGR